MTNKEESVIIKMFGQNYSYWDIPAYIRKRDEMPVPSDKTAPYWNVVRDNLRFDGESIDDYINRMSFVEDPDGLELWND